MQSSDIPLTVVSHKNVRALRAPKQLFGVSCDYHGYFIVYYQRHIGNNAPKLFIHMMIFSKRELYKY